MVQYCTSTKVLIKVKIRAWKSVCSGMHKMHDILCDRWGEGEIHPLPSLFNLEILSEKILPLPTPPCSFVTQKCPYAPRSQIWYMNYVAHNILSKEWKYMPMQLLYLFRPSLRELCTKMCHFSTWRLLYRYSLTYIYPILKLMFVHSGSLKRKYATKIIGWREERER